MGRTGLWRRAWPRPILRSHFVTASRQRWYHPSSASPNGPYPAISQSDSFGLVNPAENPETVVCGSRRRTRRCTVAPGLNRHPGTRLYPPPPRKLTYAGQFARRAKKHRAYGYLNPHLSQGLLKNNLCRPAEGERKSAIRLVWLRPLPTLAKM